MSDISALSSVPLTVLTTTDYSQADMGTGIYATNRTGNVDAISKDFEAMFLSQMLGQIFAGDELTDYFGGGSAGEIYKSYLFDQYGKSIAKAGGIGIAKQVREELLKLQEISYEQHAAPSVTGKKT